MADTIRALFSIHEAPLSNDDRLKLAFVLIPYKKEELVESKFLEIRNRGEGEILAGRVASRASLGTNFVGRRRKKKKGEKNGEKKGEKKNAFTSLSLFLGFQFPNFNFQTSFESLKGQVLLKDTRNERQLIMYDEHVKAKLKTAFAIYEQKDTPGYVYKREVPTIIRASGLNPREQLMGDIMKEVHSKDIEAEVISFDNIKKILVLALKERTSEVIRDSKETIMRAFMTFDKQGLGYINAEEFKGILESTGDQFSEEELRDFLASAADKETGNIDYEQYARLLADDGRAI